MKSRKTVAAISAALFCCIALADQSSEAVRDHLEAAETAEDRNDFETAIKEYDSALALVSDKEEILVLRAGARFKSDDFSGAIEDYSSAIALNEEDAMLYVMRGLSYSLLKPSEKARACKDFATAARLGFTEEVIPGQRGWCSEAE